MRTVSISGADSQGGFGRSAVSDGSPDSPPLELCAHFNVTAHTGALQMRKMLLDKIEAVLAVVVVCVVLVLEGVEPFDFMFSSADSAVSSNYYCSNYD
jgi:hypothetical protein